MARQTDHTDVVGEVFAAELCAEADLLAGLLELILKLDVAEGVAVFVALGGEVVVIFDGGFLHGLEIFLGRGATDDECDMVGRTGGGAESLHLLHQEGDEGLGVDDGLGLLIEIGLVGRAATLGYEHEVVFVALYGVDVDLRGEVAAGVHLVVHVEGSVLRVAEVVLGVGVIDAFGDLLFVVATGVDKLSLLAVYDGCAGVLAHGELPFGRYFGVAQHGESYILVVGRGLGIGEDLGHHEIVLAAEHESVVVCGLTREHREGFRVDYKKLVSAPVFGLDIVRCKVVILSGILPEGEHLLVVKGFSCHMFK